ncbi:hypothetical protein A3Q35_14030 [Aeribacillus pallidus]|nr:hypothetical protein A3Q35_14030 [Aeribacillus pallidus]BBU38895.1 hypothetical protein APP_11870 [Aeribacillus pallidus]
MLKKEHLVQIQENQKAPDDLDLYLESEHQSIKMWNDIQEGKRINIIVYRKKFKNTVSYFTIQGVCRHLVKETGILLGVENTDLYNPEFQEYLELLQELNKI